MTHVSRMCKRITTQACFACWGSTCMCKTRCETCLGDQRFMKGYRLAAVCSQSHHQDRNT